MCVQCRDLVRVHEVPRPFIDPERFRCHLCLSGVPPLFRDDAGVTREESRPYDPETAMFPEGY